MCVFTLNTNESFSSVAQMTSDLSGLMVAHLLTTALNDEYKLKACFWFSHFYLLLRDIYIFLLLSIWLLALWLTAPMIRCPVKGRYIGSWLLMLNKL